MKKYIKKGFSLVMAVFFVLLISTLGMLSLNFSSQLVHKSVNIYMKEQAELYAMSATELTVMAMQAYDYRTKGDCLKETHYDFGDGFVANVIIFYLDSKMICSDNRYRSQDSINTSGFFDKFHKYDNIAILNVEVTNKNEGLENIRFFKRVVQRP